MRVKSKIIIGVIGADKAARNLNMMANNMLSFQGAFEDIGEYFRDQVETQFDLRGALPGIRGPWRPLSKTTIRLRGGSSQPLVRWGALKASWTGSGRTIGEVGPKTAKFGSAHKAKSNKGKIVPTAVFHQTGTRHMPERPVVLGNKYLDEDILQAFSDHLFRGWL